MRIGRLASAGVLGLGLAFGPGCGGEAEASGPVRRVAVTIPPLKGLVEPVLGEGVQVRVLIPPGVNSHGYQPSPSDARALRAADLVVGVGLGNEGGLGATLERMAGGGSVLLMSRVAGISLHDHDHDHHHDHEGHDHGHDHAHDPGDPEQDPHLWLDPGLASLLVGAVGEAVAAREPDGGAAVRERAAALRSRIAALDEELRATLAPVAGRRIVTNHAAFARFCVRYGVEIVGVVRPFEATEPTPGELAAVRGVIEGGGADGVFLEPQLDGRVSRRMAEAAGVPVGTLDPLGDGDWFGMMRANAAELVRVLGGEG